MATKAWMQVTLANGRNYKGYAEILHEGEIGAEQSGWRLNIGVFGGIFRYDQAKHGGVVHKCSPLTDAFITIAAERNRKRAMVARLQRRGRPIGRLVESMREDTDGLGVIEDAWDRRAR